MEKKLAWLPVLLASLFSPTLACAAALSWALPTSYTSGAPIGPADVQRIVVKVYTGPSSTGPWTLGLTAPPGATSGTGPDPQPGQTLWYTLTSTLDGAESSYASPVSKTAPAEPPPAQKAPAPPANLRISLLPPDVYPGLSGRVVPDIPSILAHGIRRC